MKRVYLIEVTIESNLAMMEVPTPNGLARDIQKALKQPDPDLILTARALPDPLKQKQS